MSKTFRPWDLDQTWLLPPSIHDFVMKTIHGFEQCYNAQAAVDAESQSL